MSTEGLKRPGEGEAKDSDAIEKRFKPQSFDHSSLSEPVSTIEIIPTDKFRKQKIHGYQPKGAVNGTQPVNPTQFEEQLSTMEHEAVAAQEQSQQNTWSRAPLPPDFSPQTLSLIHI